MQASFIVIVWDVLEQMHKEEQAEVQKYVSQLKIYSSVLQAVPSIIFTLFAGSWSDIHGRKALIVTSTLGYIISNGIFMLNAYFFYELKAEYLLLEVCYYYYIFTIGKAIRSTCGLLGIETWILANQRIPFFRVAKVNRLTGYDG